jgi:serine/threonine protein phosphatase 1
MLSRLFGFATAAGPGTIPAGQAVYAIGDVHGRLDLLEDLMARIREDAQKHSADSERTLVFLGDYIDRGPESRGVVDAVMSDRPGFTTIRLLGNHEWALLSFLDGKSDGLDWLSFGGLETLLSYGVPLRGLPSSGDAVRALQRALIDAVPTGHVTFYRQCLLHYTIGNYVFVHAGVRPGIALEKQSQADLLWIRDDFLRVRTPLPGRIVVHGHTICDLPQNRRYRINIDTGAFASGRLTCLVLRGNDRRFLSTGDQTADA